jgi:hypothetical protein
MADPLADNSRDRYEQKKQRCTDNQYKYRIKNIGQLIQPGQIRTS